MRLALDSRMFCQFRLLLTIDMAASRFLCGDTLTETDVRLFPTIFRFDNVYHLRFRLNAALISESYPHLQRWLEEVSIALLRIQDYPDFCHLALSIVISVCTSTCEPAHAFDRRERLCPSCCSGPVSAGGTCCASLAGRSTSVTALSKKTLLRG